MRYVWERFRQPVPSSLVLNRQEALVALATAMMAIDDEVAPAEMGSLHKQLIGLGLGVDSRVIQRVQTWLRQVDPLELFWAGVRGLDPADRETAVRLLAQLALGEVLGFGPAQIRALVQWATQV